MKRFSPFPSALLVALATILADQLHKWYLLAVIGIEAIYPIEITQFFDLVMVWNRGISFGMLNRGEQTVWPLVTLSLAIVAVLLCWLRRNPPFFTAVALGAIIGGALGNVIDRLRFGAVADFFSLHVGNYHWPAFNIADSAICIGVVFLAIESMISGKKQPSVKDS